MSDNFDNWTSDFEFDDNDKSKDLGLIPGRGGWHWLQTLVAILIVCLLSMACAYLTRNVEERPVWMMGLIFMVPTAALMVATILVEKHTSAMTPSSSRKPQYILAVVATILTFIVACICDLIYLYGFKKPLAPALSVNVPYETSDRLLIIEDHTYSMTQSDAGTQAAGISASLLNQCASDWDVGLIAGDVSIDLAPLTAEHKNRLLSEINKTPDRGRLYYQDSIISALEMAEKAGSDRQTRIILFTDGLHTWSLNGDIDLTQRCMNANVTVSCVQLGKSIEPVLSSLIQATDGKILTGTDAPSILDQMQTTRYSSQVSPAAVEEKLKLDLLRNREPAAILICCIMLLLEGLSLGICISLMLSLKGQFRIQYILSPLMGLLAFALLKFIWDNNDIMTTWWIKEGTAFSLLGIVLMNRNRSRGAARSPVALPVNMTDDNWDL